MSDHGIETRREGLVEIWTLNRPDRMNALSMATMRELGRLARAAHADGGIRAIVVTGAGERAFCAGADLKERRQMSEEDVHAMLSLYRLNFSAIEALNKPVIAAINGVAFGGGLELALACDFRVMNSATTIGLTEVSLAIIPGAGGTQRLTRLVGQSKAKELILLAQRIDAATAEKLGVVNWVTESGQSAIDKAMEVAEQLAENAPIAVAAALDAIDGAFDLPSDAGLIHERRCYERTLASSDRLEALAAFAEKRKPQYRGE